MGTAMGDASQVVQPDPWFRTSSPEDAIHRCETAFYPHRLRLLGPSDRFGFTQRATRLGPITVGDLTYETDVALGFDEHGDLPVPAQSVVMRRFEHVMSQDIGDSSVSGHW